MISNVRQVIFFAVMAFLLACNNKSDNDSNAGNNYILLTNEADLGTPGYMAARATMPQGSLSNIGSTSLQVAEAFGFTKYKKWIFTRSNVAGQAGIQRFSVGADGKISDAGFIADGQMFHIVDDNTGYYLDEKRGTMLLQRFNPSSMQRVGQIDLSSLSMTGVEYQVVGKHILASKEGKLFVSVTYGTTIAQGYGDDVVNYVKMAVIDIATNTLEKTIQYNGLKGLGWGSSANKFWTLGDDGALYFYYSGFNEGITNSSIIRIKKGETDFDKNWILKADDLQNHSTIANALVKNGTIYIQLPSVELKPDFSNLADPMWDYYAVNVTTLKATKITGMPHTRYVHSNEQGIVQVDGKIYLWMANATTKENGYYLLNESNNTASSAFNVTDGGLVSGFFKLDN
jgi:hypothetical protein